MLVAEVPSLEFEGMMSEVSSRTLESQCINLRQVSSCPVKRSTYDSPIIWVVLLTEVRSEKERCRATVSENASFECDRDAQSTKPLHAETDARRAVSTVPPMTTNFYSRYASQSSCICKDTRSGVHAPMYLAENCLTP